MADAVKIDKEQFHDRLSSFLTQWKNDQLKGGSIFGGANSIGIVMGKNEDNNGMFQKNSAFQFWTLGYEFPATLIILTPDVVTIVTTKKKASYLEPLKDGKVALNLKIRGKDAEENKQIFEECADIIIKAGKKYGNLPKCVSTGPFADEWQQVYNDKCSGIEAVDVTGALSMCALAVKDETELRSIRDASKASSGMMKKFVVEEISEILDKEKKITHRELCDKITAKIDDNKLFDKMKLSSGFDSNQLDWAYSPLIQSGGSFDLSLDSGPDDKAMHEGVIVASLGFRYSSYASLVARSYLVEPNKSQENTYKTLLAAHEAAIKEVRDGVAASQVYNKALETVKTRNPDLAAKFGKSVGYGIGIENRDATMMLNAKSTRSLKDGMTITITTMLNGIENPKPQGKRDATYSLMLSDTVRVDTGKDAVNFTRDAETDLDSITFTFKESEEEQDQRSSKQKEKARATAVAQSTSGRTRSRNERATNQDAEREAARAAHQKELHERKQQEGTDRFGKDTGAINGGEEKKFKSFTSYRQADQLPSKVKDLVVVVDEKNQTVVLPIMGRPVPFHINTIKNASKIDEDPYVHLRINFLSPGQGVGRKDDQPFEDAQAHFVRSLTFRSKDKDRMSDIELQINDLKKLSVKREQEKKQMEDVVEQDVLIENRGQNRRTIEPVFIRPSMEGKRLAGSVSIHQNGLRYAHPNMQRVDVLFNNIEHLFFQPCDHELIVIIHVHLKNPILIGKKKTKDVQFYREATEMAFDETGNRKRRHRYGDEEEFEQEQEERRRRAALNKEFKAFTERISDAGRSENLSVDIPFRDLGFSGVPARSSVLLQPTTDCLVQLTEPPFLCVTLSQIEIVHLERVQFGLKNFDMVVVFRDFSRPPVHINTIPVESLDGVKDWLDSVDIPFSEGPLNLNWTTIMKTVTTDPHEFFKEGGWSFLSTESDDEGDEESEEESAFEVSDEEMAGLSEESSEDDSDFDEDASAEEDDEDASGLSEEGEDWDELESKAKKADRESGLEADDSRGKKKGGRR